MENLTINSEPFYTVKDSLVVTGIQGNGTRVEFSARVLCPTLAEYTTLVSICTMIAGVTVEFIYESGFMGLDNAKITMTTIERQGDGFLVDIRGIEV